MIDVIKQQFKEGMSVDQKLNVTREMLQILVLKILSEKKFFEQIAFVGGTSLRILYDLKRFFEDLDFSLVKNKEYDFDEIYKKLYREFHLYNLPFEAKVKTANNVHNMMMKFTGLPKELGLSELSGQKLSIKIGVDANPPQGWELGNTIVNNIYMFNVTHYDLPSLFAGKLHACFYRKFTKGRDFYDFMWYLGKKVRPNFTFLNNAIKQTCDEGVEVTDESFKPFLLERIQKIDFKQAKKDVERFLEDKSELNLFDRELIQGAIESM